MSVVGDPMEAMGEEATLMNDYVPQPCPECAVGKHGNCDGTTWDVKKDEPAPCPCAEAGH